MGCAAPSLLGCSVLVRYVDYTLALRAFWGRCPFRAPSGCVGSARICEVVATVGFRFLAFRAVMAKSKCRCSLMPFASWLLEALRCHKLVRSLCADAGYLLVSLPPLPMVTSLRPGITPACSRRPCFLLGGDPAASVASLPLYGCRRSWHHDAYFRLGFCGRG